MRHLFLALGVIFAFVWISAFVLFHVARFFMHVFLVLAVIFFIVHLLRPRRAR